VRNKAINALNAL